MFNESSRYPMLDQKGNNLSLRVGGAQNLFTSPGSATTHQSPLTMDMVSESACPSALSSTLRTIGGKHVNTAMSTHKKEPPLKALPARSPSSFGGNCLPTSSTGISCNWASS